VLSYYVPLRSEFRVVMSVTIFCSSVGGRIYVICVCLSIVVSNTYCVLFLFVFLRLVYPMLPVSQVSPFMISLTFNYSITNIYLIM
jgi:hypothetical protein